jgi:hypothetical protein
MPQIKSKFTPEQRLAFENKYEIGVYSHEAMIELLMQFDERLRIQNAENVNGFFDHDKRIQQLEERLMEMANEIILEQSFRDSSG